MHMIGRKRAAMIASLAVFALVAGGAAAAWASSNDGAKLPARFSASDVTDSTTDTTAVSPDTGTTSTSIDDSSSTTTSVEDTTTTTLVAPDTSVPESTTTTTVCKPGWGWGDTNHCHSGPPGHKKDDDGDEQGENQNEGNDHGHGAGHGPGHQHGSDQGSQNQQGGDNNSND
jgi:hypothetical protein